MRRKDREVTDFCEIIKIIDSCDCCRLGLVDGNEAYIVPLNFGYDVKGMDLTLYFHSAKEGRKICLLEKQEIVTFELDTNHKLVESKEAASYTYLFQSVMGKGIVEVIEDLEEKSYGLSQIMHHYTNKADWDFKKNTLEEVKVMKLSVKELSCKSHVR